MALTTISHTMQFRLYVLQIMRVKQRTNTMVRYSFQESRNYVLVWPSRWKRSRGSTNVPSHVTLRGSTTQITHLEPFIGICVNIGSMEATSNICRDLDVIQAMYCMPGLFVWCCAVPSTEETMNFRVQGDMNFLCSISSQESPPEVCRWI